MLFRDLTFRNVKIMFKLCILYRLINIINVDITCDQTKVKIDIATISRVPVNYLF